MKRITLPLAISMVLFTIYLTVLIVASEWRDKPAIKYLQAAILIAFFTAVVRLIDRFLFDILFVKRNKRQAPALLRGLLATTLYIIALLFIARSVLNTELGIGVLATSTVISVILGLALQDTLGNLFAGISLHVEQQFRILDAIRIGDMVGKVESVTWRTTAIRTNNNSIVLYPNSRVAREAIEIYPFNNLNRRVMPFPAPYSVLPETVIAMIRDSVTSLPGVASEKTPIVRINNFADSYVNYEVLYWVKDYMLTNDLDTKIRERIWYLYRRNGIEIPFPIRHLLVENVERARAAAPGDNNCLQAVEAVSLFEPLCAEERVALADAAVQHIYAPGEPILRRGDAGDSMFIVQRGKVEVRLPATNSDQQPVAVLDPGGYFGEMGLLTGEPRTADVTAIGEASILEIKKSALQPLLQENTALAAALSERVANRQAQLSELSQVMPEDEKLMRKESILRRVQRFFSLS